MRTVVFDPGDCIEAILPIIESAMASGDVCRIENVAHLGPFDSVADGLRAMLADQIEGTRKCTVHPGFRLLGIDERGVTHTLML
jgi:hypothetical protein